MMSVWLKVFILVLISISAHADESRENRLGPDLALSAREEAFLEQKMLAHPMVQGGIASFQKRGDVCHAYLLKAKKQIWHSELDPKSESLFTFEGQVICGRHSPGVDGNGMAVFALAMTGQYDRDRFTSLKFAIED